MTRAPERSSAYLDYGATTPVMREVVDEMLVYLRDDFANPSGIYRAARAARRAIDDARDLLALEFGCASGEIVFTSGGTEADNLAILGIERREGTRVVVSAIEHHGVLRPAESIGAAIAPVGRDGLIDLSRLVRLLGDETELVSLMAVNNEVGTIQPMAAVVELVKTHAPNALIHCDAVQALAFCDVKALTNGCDLVSYSAHKIGGPKGIGALVVNDRARARLQPILRGGSQERDLRAGTENVAGIAGFAVAARLTSERRVETVERVRALRDRFVDSLIHEIPGVHESVARNLRHVGNAHLVFPGITNEELLLLLDRYGVAASAGSSCASGAIEPSHVLLAMGMTPDEARSCIRFTLGQSSSGDEIDYAIASIIAAHRQIVARDRK